MTNLVFPMFKTVICKDAMQCNGDTFINMVQKCDAKMDYHIAGF